MRRSNSKKFSKRIGHSFERASEEITPIIFL
jgi:hypothetical protein